MRDLDRDAGAAANLDGLLIRFNDALNRVSDLISLLDVVTRCNYTASDENGIVLVVIHTETDEVIRIISARKATKYEEKKYFEEIAD